MTNMARYSIIDRKTGRTVKAFGTQTSTNDKHIFVAYCQWLNLQETIREMHESFEPDEDWNASDGAQFLYHAILRTNEKGNSKQMTRYYVHRLLGS